MILASSYYNLLTFSCFLSVFLEQNSLEPVRIPDFLAFDDICINIINISDYSIVKFLNLFTPSQAVTPI